MKIVIKIFFNYVGGSGIIKVVFDNKRYGIINCKDV